MRATSRPAAINFFKTSGESVAGPKVATILVFLINILFISFERYWIMFTIDEINDMLDEIAGELPEEIFRDLNGGVSLSAETKKSDKDPSGGLYTLGEYRRDQMGRYIIIYYGSLCEAYGSSSPKKMRKHLRDVLTHELTHHLESLAGDRSLEKEDAENLNDYFSRKKRLK